jgi:hypothetical protein
MSEKTLLKRLDKLNDMIFQNAEKNYQGNLDSGGEGRATGKRDAKVAKLFKERDKVRAMLNKLKSGGRGGGGGVTLNLTQPSRNKMRVGDFLNLQ